jgi:hypothetical protein
MASKKSMGRRLQVIVVVVSCVFNAGCGRQDPPHKSTWTLSWQGGEVGLYDYCLHPGTYDWKCEWHGSSGEKVLLVHLGDNESSAICDTGGSLYVSYVTGYGDQEWLWRTEVFETPGKRVKILEHRTKPLDRPPAHDVSSTSKCRAHYPRD